MVKISDEQYTNYAVALITLSIIITAIGYFLGKSKVSFALIFSYVILLGLTFTVPMAGFSLSVPLLLILFIKHRTDISGYFTQLKTKMI